MFSPSMSHSPKPITTYDVSRGEASTSLSVQIHAPRLRSENLDLTTWGSSYVLANALHQIPISKHTFCDNELNILELGAGTGLVGLSASLIWEGNVILTDLPGIVPGLSQNIDSNNELLKAGGRSAKCGSLDWNRPGCLLISDKAEGVSRLDSASSKASIIVAADTIYDADHPKMLVDTILTWLAAGEHSRVVIAYPLRVAYLDAIREMWERLEAGGLISIQEGRADAGDEFEDEKLIEWAVFKWKVS